MRVLDCFFQEIRKKSVGYRLLSICHNTGKLTFLLKFRAPFQVAVNNTVVHDLAPIFSPPLTVDLILVPHRHEATMHAVLCAQSDRKRSSCLSYSIRMTNTECDFRSIAFKCYGIIVDLLNLCDLTPILNELFNSSVVPSVRLPGLWQETSRRRRRVIGFA